MKPRRRRSKSKPTNLKRTKRGYTRNLGRKADGSQPKFYLGHDREQAVLREKRLVALWHHIEKWVGMPEKIWTPDYLEATKAIAKGETPEGANGIVRQAREAFGPIDILVHAAGFSDPCFATDLTWAQYRKTMSINCDGTFAMVMTVIEEMIERNFGRIVTVASIAALRERENRWITRRRKRR